MADDGQRSRGLAPLSDRRRKCKGARPGWDGGLYAYMRRMLATPAGAARCRQRSAMIEPVFADTKFNRKIDRFQRVVGDGRGSPRLTSDTAV